MLPGGQTAEDVATMIADGIRTGTADIYTRPQAVETVIDHLRTLARPS
jgi:hypothetical protein